jgi:hypothetical protein
LELVHSQWRTIQRMLVEQLVAHACPEPLAQRSLNTLPGQRLIEEGAHS